MIKEPINLCEWRGVSDSPLKGHLFTCGRPGRATYGLARQLIDVDTIDRWVSGLPQAEILHIISLLGRKTDGYSEFDYYPFRSSYEQNPKPPLERWLEERYGQRFVVHEFPTVDARGIPPQVLEVVQRRVHDLIEAGNTVVVMDSAGAERTARVCEAAGFVKCKPT